MKTLRTLIAVLMSLAWSGAAFAQSWQPLQHQPTFTASTALLLTDGTVLVHQYFGSQVWKLTPDINGSYVNGTWSQLANLPTGYSPLYYASAVLSDGRVIFEGGEYNGGSQNFTNLGAIYDPLANHWTSVTAPSGWTTIGDAENVVLSNGTFMLAQALTKSQALFNAQTLTWRPTGQAKIDINDEEGWTLLPDGTVLTVDTFNNSDPTHAEKYIPTLGRWISAGSTIVQLADPGSHEIGPAVLRPDGTVFATGATGRTAIYTPASNPRDPGTWVTGPSFGSGLDIADGPASLLPSGNVLCATSPGIFGPGTKFFEFDGTSLTSVPKTPNSPQKASYEFRTLLLPTGQVFASDGTKDVEIYTPVGSPDPAWAPVITTAPTQVTRGNSYSISGRQFNGLSQDNMYGDDASAATNYPLVRITNQATGHVFFARTHNHSSMAVATGNRTVSTHFDVPAAAETGSSDLQVVTNGIASDAVSVTVQ